MLLGLRCDAPELFRDMPWGSAQVAARTVERATAAGRSVARLAAWYDVDGSGDFNGASQVALGFGGPLLDTGRTGPDAGVIIGTVGFDLNDPLALLNAKSD